MWAATNDYHSQCEAKYLKQYVDSTVEVVKELVAKDPSITHIACCGASGQSIAWPVGYLTGLNVLIIRKHNDSAHDNKRVVGDGIVRGYIVIDDFVCSGATLDHVLDAIDDVAMSEQAGSPPECKGIVLWKYGPSTGRFLRSGCRATVPSYDVSQRRLAAERARWNATTDAIVNDMLSPVTARINLPEFSSADVYDRLASANGEVADQHG